MSAISENIQSVSSISDIQNMSEELQKNPDRLKEFLNSIPNIALGLLGKIIIIAIVFFIGSRLIRFVRKLLRKALERAGTSRNAINFVDTCLKYVLYILLVLGILTNFGLEATSIVAFIGSLGVTIGLALQGSLSNLASIQRSYLICGIAVSNHRGAARYPSSLAKKGNFYNLAWECCIHHSLPP